MVGGPRIQDAIGTLRQQLGGRPGQAPGQAGPGAAPAPPAPGPGMSASGVPGQATLPSNAPHPYNPNNNLHGLTMQNGQFGVMGQHGGFQQLGAHAQGQVNQVLQGQGGPQAPGQGGPPPPGVQPGANPGIPQTLNGAGPMMDNAPRTFAPPPGAAQAQQSYQQALNNLPHTQQALGSIAGQGSNLGAGSGFQGQGSQRGGGMGMNPQQRAQGIAQRMQGLLRGYGQKPNGQFPIQGGVMGWGGKLPPGYKPPKLPFGPGAPGQILE